MANIPELLSGRVTLEVECLDRLCLNGLIFRPPRTNRYFVTPYGWKIGRLFSRL